MSLIQQLHSSETNEWYTPKKYIDMAHEVMNGIHLDPASNEEASKIIQSGMYFDKEDNGLSRQWFGNVWLNPPYGKTSNKSNAGIWANYLIEQYQKGNVKQAILLVNASMDTEWFEPLWNYDICLTHQRIKFWQPSGAKNQPTKGNCFVYFGSNLLKFYEVFNSIGEIIPSRSKRLEIIR